jgi:hypothetical protein
MTQNYNHSCHLDKVHLHCIRILGRLSNPFIVEHGSQFLLGRRTETLKDTQ